MGGDRALRWRLASRLFAALALIALLLWVVTWNWTPTWCCSRVAVAQTRGQIAVGWGSTPIEATPRRSSLPMWTLKEATSGARCSVGLGPGVCWRPNFSHASAIVASSTVGGIALGSATYTIDVLWIPAWWPPAICVLLALGAARWARTLHAPGACRGCGYSLAGLAGGTPCPECGSPGSPVTPGSSGGSITPSEGRA